MCGWPEIAMGPQRRCLLDSCSMLREIVLPRGALALLRSRESSDKLFACGDSPISCVTTFRSTQRRYFLCRQSPSSPEFFTTRASRFYELQSVTSAIRQALGGSAVQAPHHAGSQQSTLMQPSPIAKSFYVPRSHTESQSVAAEPAEDAGAATYYGQCRADAKYSAGHKEVKAVGSVISKTSMSKRCALAEVSGMRLKFVIMSDGDSPSR